MSIAVQHQNDEDRQEAEEIANFINNNYDYFAFASKSSGIGFSSFEGVIVVGGSNANDIYEDMVNKHNWTQLLCGNSFYGDTGIVTDIVLEEGTPTQGVAGCTADDTALVTEWYLGKSTTQKDSFTLGAGIDDFIERINDEQAEDGDGEEVEDPTDPIIEPEDPGNTTGAVPDMPVRVIVEGQKLNLPDVEPYSFKVDGWAKEVDSKFDDLGTQQDQPFEDHRFEGKTGGGDKDIYMLAEDAEITDFEADSDKRVVVNGTNYNYNADKDKFEEDFQLIWGAGADEDNADVIADDQKTQETIDKEKERQNKSFLERLGIDSNFDKAIAGAITAFLLYIVAQAMSGQDINIKTGE